MPTHRNSLSIKRRLWSPWKGTLAMAVARMSKAPLTIALCVLASGCTVTTTGTVVAAPTLGHAPQPVSTAALSTLLLSTADAGSIMGAPVSLVSTSQGMYENKPLDDGCLVWAEAQRHTYAGSGWTAVRDEELRDRPDDSDHIVYQAVVAFPDAASASALFAAQKVEWARCDDRRVDLHDPSDPNAHYWSLNTATDEDGVLTITRSEEDLPGWSCQHAMTSKNNVVVDVAACAMNVDDRGAKLARRIAEKIDDQ